MITSRKWVTPFPTMRFDFLHLDHDRAKVDPEDRQFTLTATRHVDAPAMFSMKLATVL